MVGNVNAVEYVQIVVQELQVPVYRPVGTLIIRFAIPVINKETKDSLVLYVEKLIEQQLTEKWYNVISVKNLSTVLAILTRIH